MFDVPFSFVLLETARLSQVLETSANHRPVP